MLRFSGFELDQERAELRRPDGETIKLRPKTLEMLRLFAANTGRVLSKQDLMETVWPNVHVGEDSLFQCIREIRAGLGDNKRQIVRVISGRGYLFDAEGTGTAAVDLPEQAATSQSARVAPDAEAPVETSSIAATRRFAFRLRSRFALAGAAGLAVLGIAIAAAALRPGLIPARGPATIAVMPVTTASGDPLATQMAADVSDRLGDGLAKIENIRLPR